MKKIELNWYELQKEVLTLKDGRRFYFNDYLQPYYLITEQSEIHTHYIDADERPHDHSHDGNGWTEKVRTYTLGREATEDERKELDFLRVDKLTCSFTEPRSRVCSWAEEKDEVKAAIYEETTKPLVERLRRDVPGYIGPDLPHEPYGPYVPAVKPAAPAVELETL